MKKLLLLSLFTFSFANAQTTLFAENWDGVGPGVAGWTLYNLDGLNPVGPGGTDGEALSFLVQDAWNVLTLAEITAANSAYTAHPAGATGMANNIIASNSWYSPTGIANDWLVSPQITIPAGSTGIDLKWAASSLGSAAFLEDYEVYVSPTGGSAVADFTALLLDVNNELSAGSYRTASLNAYIGQTIRIAFRNNGNDQYIMFLDNISVTATTILSTSDFLAGKFSIYPNPAKNLLSVLNTQNINVTEITIADLNGRIVKTVKNNNISDIQINVSDLAAGMYVMNINSDQGIATKKIVKE